MTPLETVRDQIKTAIDAATAHLAVLTAMHTEVEAAIARPPTLDDVKALVARIP